MTKEISIVELAIMVKGRIIGNPSEGKISGTCSIDSYIPNKVSFVKNRKYCELLARLHNRVVLIPESLADLCEKYPQNIYIVVEDVVNSLMDTQDFFYSGMKDEGIAATASIDKSAEIGRHVYIGEYVCIYQGCQIGNDCIIHAGAVIGADGFRYEQFVEQKIVRKMLHVGGVIIGDRVEIGANSTIDRATFEGDATIICDDVKIDNLVHIAHNAKIGARTVIVAQTCIGGSTRIGEDVWIGIGAAITDNVNIGNRAKVLLNAVVAYDVPEDEMVSGFYAMPHRQWKQVYRKLKEEI